MKLHLGALLALLPVSSAYADIFHYNNVIIGDRAIGLAGAYAGVSDDASGIAYNPAGLAYAIGNDLSGSANAYYTRKTTYKNILPGLNFEEKSQGMMPSFFGGIQKLDSVAKGLVAGFAVYSPDSEVKDQDDSIKNSARGVESFHRTVKVSASTLHMAAAAAYRFTSSFSLGASLGFVYLSEINQDFQASVLSGSRCYTATTGKTCYVSTSSGRSFLVPESAHQNKILMVSMTNSNQNLTAQALEPSLGTQYIVGSNLVLGASVRLPISLGQTFTRKTDRSEVYRYADGRALTRADLLTPTAEQTRFSQPAEFTEVSYASATPLGDARRAIVESDSPLGALPYAVRGGVAWFATPKILWTADAMFHSEAKEGDLEALNRSATFNYATGLEYYLTPSLPARIGFFTNNDARPALETDKANPQVETVDYLGGSFYLSWAESSSQFGGGAVYQAGKGKANKVAGAATQQDVTSQSIIFAFSASHQL